LHAIINADTQIMASAVYAVLFIFLMAVVVFCHCF